MNCLPLANRFKRLGRILSKMLPSRCTSAGYYRLPSNEKENIPLDHEKTSYFPSNCSVPSTSPWTSPVSFRPMDDMNLWSPIRDENTNDLYATSRTYLSSSSDSSKSSFESTLSSSSKYNQQTRPMPNIYNVFKIYNESSSDSLLLPSLSLNSTGETSSSSFDAPQPKSYSPVQSNFLSDLWFNSEFDKELEEITASILDEKTRQEELRLDFEMNGKTTELDQFFSPSVSSTPMTSRKSLTLKEGQSFEWRKLPRESPENTFCYKRNNFQNKKKPKPHKKSLEDHCVFCKNNGLHESEYSSHTVKDRYGRVSCPKLRLYKCPICSESGDKAHTMKYCPKKPIVTLEDLERMGNSNPRKEKHRRRT